MQRVCFQLIKILTGADCFLASSQTPTVSKSVATLRKILSDNKGKDTLYGKAADGKIPLVVHTENKVGVLSNALVQFYH
jgi:hypothetical protein